MDIELAGKNRPWIRNLVSRRLFSIFAVLALGTSALAVSTTASGSTTSGSCHTQNGIKITDAAVCRGLAYFRGKTVTFITPSSAGSGFDIESRAFAQVMDQYFGASFNVEDISNTIAGENALAASTPNGLTIGLFNLGTTFYDVITNAPGLSFSLKNVSLFGGTPSGPTVLFTQSNTQYTSFAVLKKEDNSANPVKILFNPSSAAVAAVLLLREFALSATYVSGYSSSGAVVTGFIRGDGPLAAVNPQQLDANIAAGTVRPLVVMTLLKLPTSYPYSLMSHVPTVATLLEKYPPKTNGEKAAVQYATETGALPAFVIGGPTAMPSYLVTTMRAAVKWAARTGYVKAQNAAEGNVNGYTSPAIVNAALLSGLKSSAKIQAFLGY